MTQVPSRLAGDLYFLPLRLQVAKVAKAKSICTKDAKMQRCKGAKGAKVQKDFHIDQITKLQNCKRQNQIGLLGGEA